MKTRLPLALSLLLMSSAASAQDAASPVTAGATGEFFEATGEVAPVRETVAPSASQDDLNLFPPAPSIPGMETPEPAAVSPVVDPVVAPPATVTTAPPAPRPNPVAEPVATVPAAPPEPPDVITAPAAPGPIYVQPAPIAPQPPPMTAPVAAKSEPAAASSDQRFSDPLYMSLYFYRNRSELPESMQKKLARGVPDLRRNLERYPRLVIELAGHTDPHSEKGEVQALSLARAQAAKAILVARGLPEHRIKLSGHGGTNPVVSKGDTSRNSRVEILTYPE